MLKPQSNTILLLSGAAALVLLGAGALLFGDKLRSSPAPVAVEQAALAEEAKATEGFVALSDEQTQAAGIVVVSSALMPRYCTPKPGK